LACWFSGHQFQPSIISYRAVSSDITGCGVKLKLVLKHVAFEQEFHYSPVIKKWTPKQLQEGDFFTSWYIT